MKKIKDNYYPHYSNDKYCLVVNDHVVYKYIYQTHSFEKYFQIPASSNALLTKIKDKIARSAMVRKYKTNMGLGHVVELPSKVVLVIYDKIYRFDPNADKNTATVIFDFAGTNILPPLRNGIAITPSGDVYFGEYANKKGRDIKIIGIVENGTKLNVCHTFSGQEIKHIHGIYWDEFRAKIWITTGDSDEQSWFYYSEDNLLTLHKFKGGNQTWRAVSLMFFEDSLVWGMDAGKDATKEDINYIYRYDFHEEKLEQITKIDGPAYHCTQTESGGYYLGVNYEPGCKQPIDQEAAIWYSNNGIDWQKKKVLAYQASPHINGSKYAYIYQPSGIVPNDNFLFTSTNTGAHSGKLYSLENN
ncbi:hypothetical protein AADZ91_08000 [Colwelliaceae bacterium 6441]